MNDQKFNLAIEWFESLRDEIIETIQDIDGKEFIITNWKHNHEGGGKISKIKGNVIEKGGVNISTVSGNFNKNMIDSIPGTASNSSYKATGISVVFHPMSPHIPSMHFNTRYLTTTKSWFGGGMDLTPCLDFDTESQIFHKELEDICNRYNDDYYPKYKKWCDEYFYLKHRKEPRGIGGIFFDHLNSGNQENDFEFVKDVGKFFLKHATYLINKDKDRAWTSREKDVQLIKRGRYVEFNLLYDRGTKFGLETGGNTEAILMSMPPIANWE